MVAGFKEEGNEWNGKKKFDGGGGWVGGGLKVLTIKILYPSSLKQVESHIIPSQQY